MRSRSLVSLSLLAAALCANPAAGLAVLVAQSASPVVDVAGRLEQLGHTVTVEPAATWGADYDYSRFDVVALTYTGGNPADIAQLVAAVDAGDVGVVVFRGLGAEATTNALGLTEGAPVGYQGPTQLSVVDGDHALTRDLPVNIALGFDFMSAVADPAATARVLGVGPGGAAALVAHDSRRAVIVPFYGHQSGYALETVESLALTQRALGWAAELDATLGETTCTSALNSTGQAATLEVHGSTSVDAADLQLHARDLPVGEFGYFLASRSVGHVANPGGSRGTLCLGQPLGRFAALVAAADATGQLVIDVDLSSIPNLGAVAAGEAWLFQCWYRDRDPLPTSNFTSAVRVQFE